MSSACSGSPYTAIAWSSPPVGAPTYSCSARTHAVTSSSRVRPSPKTSSTATATLHSRAAELDSPAPIGTSLLISTSTPLSTSSASSTPVTYDAHGSASSSRSTGPPRSGNRW